MNATPTVSESWDRIETWLSAHAPATFEALSPPAKPRGISVAEETTGLTFPEPLKESLLRHDGSNDVEVLPPFWALLSAGEIARTWELKTRINGDEDWDDEDEEDDDVDSSDPDAEYGPWWHREWIPFAADGCGDALVIDLRPGPRTGRVGDADHEQGCSFGRFPMWTSFAALLDATATSLETGEPAGSYEPFVNDEGVLCWNIL